MRATFQLRRLTAFFCLFTVAFWWRPQAEYILLFDQHMWNMRIGVTRNLYCNPDALRDVEPPFNGQLLPANFTLVERKYLLIQFTKLVDVYDDTQKHVGYFYEAWLLREPRNRTQSVHVTRTSTCSLSCASGSPMQTAGFGSRHRAARNCKHRAVHSALLYDFVQARYASFLSRFKPIIEYNVQRCAGAFVVSL